MLSFRTIVLAWGIIGVLTRLSMGQSAEPIRSVEILRSLSPEDAAKASPVRLTGVVTYRGWLDFVIHDGQASIFADFRFSIKKGLWQGPMPSPSEIEAGALVEIEGVTDPGGFSPMVLVTKCRRIGTQSIPPPIKPSIGQLLSGTQDSHWVEVEGVVHQYEYSSANAGPTRLSLAVEGQSCQVILRQDLSLTREQLVDAKVRVRGVLLNIANLRSQVSGLKLHSNGEQDIDVLLPPPADPFKAGRVALNRLITFDPNADPNHRKVTSGVVIFVMPRRFFYLLDGGASVRVESSEAGIKAGDMVEVSGFINTTSVLAMFSEAVVRVIGKGEVPAPELASIEKILNPKVRSDEEMVSLPGHPDMSGRLIRLSGVLRRVLPADNEGTATLMIESGEDLIQSFVPVFNDEASRRISQWVEGSTVEISGVCELEIDSIDSPPWFSVTGFHLWMSSPEDLRLVSTPPWWTPPRLGILLAGVLLALFLSLAWANAMRRRVSIRGTQLAAEIAARESSKLEFDTILRERRRLANDLHDNLEQSLTGLALQLEIANRSRVSDPALSERHLNIARQFLERSRREAHRTIWDLRAPGHEGKDFLDILVNRISSMLEGSGIALILKREGDPSVLMDLVAGNLMLLAQEAVTNSLKHADASEISIRFRVLPNHAELVIEDNGRGFISSDVPGQYEGHFGLQGMRERTKRLGGQIELRTSPEQGTTIHVRVPLSVEQAPELAGNKGSEDSLY